jgi:hypothetical protein
MRQAKNCDYYDLGIMTRREGDVKLHCTCNSLDAFNQKSNTGNDYFVFVIRLSEFDFDFEIL